MNLKREFSNMRLNSIKIHNRLNIMAAVGFRSCLILNDSLDVLQRYLDSDKNEKYYCSEFIDITLENCLGRIKEDFFESESNHINKFIKTDSINGHKGIPCETQINLHENFTSQEKEEFEAEIQIKEVKLNNSIRNDKIMNLCYSDQPLISKYTNKESQKTLLCLGGESGIIKIIDIGRGSLISFLRGHTGAINELKYYKGNLYSCSEDTTIRIWDINKIECLGVIGGILGHKDNVLSFDIAKHTNFLASTGTDSLIKQWNLDLYKNPFKFVNRPLNTFKNIHKATIEKIRYYGDFILTLSNNIVSVIYNNRELEEVTNNQIIDKELIIMVGMINFYDNCIGIEIKNHILIGMSNNGDVYLFDLRELGEQKSPFIIETKVKNVIGFAVSDEHIFISSGDSIHRVKLDFSRFEELESF